MPIKQEIIAGPTKEPDLKASDIDKLTSYEEPESITKFNVVHWCEHYKKLEGVKGANVIRAKAKRFVELECIEYSKEKKSYLCKPIKDYNKTFHYMHNTKDELGFDCSCQFYQKVIKNGEGYICSHILALFMQLKIWNWKRREEKQELDKINKMYKEAGIENPSK